MLFLRICQAFSWMKIKLLSLWLKPCTATNEIRATEQLIYVHEALLVMLYDMVRTFQSVNEAIVCEQSKAIEQYFHVEPFVSMNVQLIT